MNKQSSGRGQQTNEIGLIGGEEARQGDVVLMAGDLNAHLRQAHAQCRQTGWEASLEHRLTSIGEALGGWRVLNPPGVATYRGTGAENAVEEEATHEDEDANTPAPRGRAKPRKLSVKAPSPTDPRR